MMRTLWMSPELSRRIIDEALKAKPNEVCGLIVGQGEHATHIIPIDNVHADPTHYFRMDPTALAQHLPALDRNGQRLLGFYHSHPSGDPVPSETDIHEAAYHDTAHVIVSLKGETPRVAAWLVDGVRAQPLSLHITDDAPIAAFDERPLSKAQRMAVMITGIIAFVAFIIAAVYLLPPPPIIP